MSLDVYLKDHKEVKCTCDRCGNEHNTTISEELYWANITHNLIKMANEAGIYEALWRPEEIGATKAKDIVGKLRLGLDLLKSDPIHFKQFDAKNGWGTYEHFIPFVEKYLQSCVDYPEANIYVSR